MIGDIQYGDNKVGEDSIIMNNVALGFPTTDKLKWTGYPGTVIGKNALVRTGTTIYCDVKIGDNFQTGHNVMIRENTKIGNNVKIGTNTVIEGNCTLGDNINIQSNVFIPTNTVIGNNVFIGPGVVMANDKYPPSGWGILGPYIDDEVVIGAHATILPGVKLGKRCAIAAGAIVTKDVPENTLAMGTPAQFYTMPKEMVKS